MHIFGFIRLYAEYGKMVFIVNQNNKVIVLYIYRQMNVIYRDNLISTIIKLIIKFDINISTIIILSLYLQRNSVLSLLKLLDK